ncbi:MAG: hypothetical protein PF630_05350, partial [Gammaproteobacteria bacterium]|nr:hypothetical protein [Gammaproteobacteria bacterium]
PGQHQQRTVTVFHRLTLLWIEGGFGWFCHRGIVVELTCRLDVNPGFLTRLIEAVSVKAWVRQCYYAWRREVSRL